MVSLDFDDFVFELDFLVVQFYETGDLSVFLSDYFDLIEGMRKVS